MAEPAIEAWIDGKGSMITTVVQVEGMMPGVRFPIDGSALRSFAAALAAGGGPRIRRRDGDDVIEIAPGYVVGRDFADTALWSFVATLGGVLARTGSLGQLLLRSGQTAHVDMAERLGATAAALAAGRLEEAGARDLATAREVCEAWRRMTEDPRIVRRSRVVASVRHLGRIAAAFETMLPPRESARATRRATRTKAPRTLEAFLRRHEVEHEAERRAGDGMAGPGSIEDLVRSLPADGRGVTGWG